MPTSRIRELIPAVAALALVFVSWQIYVVTSGVSPRVLPSPSRILEQGWAHRGDIAPHALATVEVTAVGFALSLSAAWILATTADFLPWMRRALVPLLVVSQTLPIIAVAPLMIIWFGIGLLPKVLLVALATFFPIAVGLIEGFAATGRDATALFRSMGASRWQQFRYLRVPAAMPRFCTALRIGVTYAVVAAVFAEYAGAEHGLGVYMLRQKQIFRTDLVLAAVLVTSVLTLLLYAATYLVERLIAPWAAADRARSAQR
ncbi:ABC transporter permease [Skermania piniformis]|uniref:ABC transporter permease n=1 Tax=Skermania pinensis TaxID=39122 RepID=A0ABX8SA21_9ACTN|nr:ABC transporter permease [Skermania piniformis]QXQ14703.1 ABC transporter permease [Skermania piniformis]